MAGTAPKRGRLAELDALRGIGALLVLNFHYTRRFHEMFPAAPHTPFEIGGGNYRVLLFFAISGFAIFFTTRRMTSASDFLVNRAVRLLPAYWAAMLLTLVTVHAGGVGALQVPFWTAAVNLTMLQGFFFVPAVDGGYWTLTVEVAFYVCVMMLWLVCRLRHIERWILLWLLLRLVEARLWIDMPTRLAMLLCLDYAPFFAIGMASWRVWAGERRWGEQWPVLAATLITIIATESWDVALVAGTLMVIFWAMVEGWLGWLAIGPLIWVGRISYSLYLVHQYIGFTVMLRAEAAGIGPIKSYGLAIACAFLLGWLVNRMVERPAARWLTARWEARRARTGAPLLAA